jgi:NAD-dependent SIR2 family protein deacetylase
MNNELNNNIEKIYQEAAELIFKSKHILITAGAGMGVDSGLPDFRGEDGFYEAYPGFKNATLKFSDIANSNFLFQDPDKFWWFYGHRFELYNQTTPHNGYKIIKRWLDVRNGFIITSNVDGHFQKVGVPVYMIKECHGAIRFLQCAINCTSSLWKVTKLPLKTKSEAFEYVGSLPRCPSCGGFARPAIFMFNDMNWNAGLTSKQEDIYYSWESKIEKEQLVVIEIGVGKNIPSIRRESESMRVPMIRINIAPADAEVDNGISIPVGALEALQGINSKLVNLDPSFFIS